MPQAQSVSCFVMLAAGSRYETAESNGIAHFAEHMFFKGTEKRPTARDISAEIDAIGGEFNAFTGKEITGYYVRCAGESRDIALDVLVDMLRHSRFDAEEIEREKGVIIEEMNMYFDTPRDYISGVYDDLVWGDHPLGWDILGRKETIHAATRETFISYLDRWYTADRMVVGVAGAIGEGLDERLAELLGDVPAGERGSPEPLNGTPSGRARLFTKQSDQAHLCLGFRTHEIDHPDRYVVDVLRVVLGGGMSSRLFTEVRERRGLAYYVLAMIQGYRDTGSLFAQAGVDVKRVDEAIETIVGEFRKIAEEPVPADELGKAKAYAKGRFVLSLESPQGVNMFGLRREVLEDAHPDPSRGARRRRRRHRRGCPARGAGADHGRGAAARGDRPVRRRRALREAPPLTTGSAAPPLASGPQRARAVRGLVRPRRRDGASGHAPDRGARERQARRRPPSLEAALRPLGLDPRTRLDDPRDGDGEARAPVPSVRLARVRPPARRAAARHARPPRPRTRTPHRAARPRVPRRVRRLRPRPDHGSRRRVERACRVPRRVDAEARDRGRDAPLAPREARARLIRRQPAAPRAHLLGQRRRKRPRGPLRAARRAAAASA